MEFLLLKILIGFIVGTLIGLTGLGGGVLLLPRFIFGLRVPAIIAVGTDALFNFFTKIPAGIMHLRKGTVRGKVVLAMAVGSVPGSYLGVTFLQHLRHVYGVGVNDFIKSAVGLLLVLIPTLLLFQGRIEEHLAKREPTMKSFAGMSVIGLVGGFRSAHAVDVKEQYPVGSTRTDNYQRSVNVLFLQFARTARTQ